MQMMSCPNCGQPISLLGHQCPFCHIKIVGASGLSKLMRQAGNSPVMLAGGLFLIAFFVCIVILWKMGMTEGRSTSGNAARLPTLRIGQAEPGFSEKNAESKPGSPAGTWIGKFINTLGDSGGVELTLKEEPGHSLSGHWNGASLQNVKRAEDNQILWQSEQNGKLWKFSARIHEQSLMIAIFQALDSDNTEGSAATGTAFLWREGAGPSSSSNLAAFAGIWTGLYADGHDNGVTMIDLHADKAGGLSGTWNGKASITQAKISGGYLEWECDQGGMHYHNLGGIFGDGNKLVLIFSGTDGSGKSGYAGSALYSKNP
jgi:hypothetical protein